jgi:hypothetical protein
MYCSRSTCGNRFGARRFDSGGGLANMNLKTSDRDCENCGRTFVTSEADMSECCSPKCNPLTP